MQARAAVVRNDSDAVVVGGNGGAMVVHHGVGEIAGSWCGRRGNVKGWDVAVWEAAPFALSPIPLPLRAAPFAPLLPLRAAPFAPLLPSPAAFRALLPRPAAFGSPTPLPGSLPRPARSAG